MKKAGPQAAHLQLCAELPNYSYGLKLKAWGWTSLDSTQITDPRTQTQVTQEVMLSL